MQKRSTKKVTILDDSIKKYLNGWQLSKKVSLIVKCMSSIFLLQQQIV